MALAFNLSIKIKCGRQRQEDLCSSSTACSTERAPGWPRLNRLCQKTKRKKERKKKKKSNKRISAQSWGSFPGYTIIYMQISQNQKEFKRKENSGTFLVLGISDRQQLTSTQVLPQAPFIYGIMHQVYFIKSIYLLSYQTST